MNTRKLNEHVSKEVLEMNVVSPKTVTKTCLIGINGKMGNGKDTVGKIIQYLTSQEAIVKGSFSDCEKFGYAYDVNWEIKKFAGKLKTIASLLTGIPVDKFEDQELKKLEMPKEWSMTFRELLQKLGTEAMRDGLHTDVWINALFADYKPQYAPYKYLGDLLEDKHHGVLNNPKWIITDTRFPNEFNAIKERGGINIRVVRPDMHSLQDMLSSHPSETALDEYSFDYEIINNGTLEDLVEKVKVILIKEGILYE